jgi:hypothetical protein
MDESFTPTAAVMAGSTAFIVGRIIMGSDINDRPWFDIELATVQEVRSFLFRPFDNLYIASHIYCAAPGIVTQRSMDHPVHFNHLSSDFNQGWCR